MSSVLFAQEMAVFRRFFASKANYLVFMVCPKFHSHPSACS